MKIIIYGGIDEIGGNKILVEQNNTRMFLDFGTSMGYESIFFSEFLQPRNATGLHDRLEIGALPKISGVYRRDMFHPSGLDQLQTEEYPRLLRSDSDYFTFKGLSSYEEYRESEGRSFVKALFLSHAHLDHTGAIDYLHTDIDLYCTPITKTLIQAIDQVTAFKSKAIDTKTNDIGFTKEKSMFPSSPRITHNTIRRACNTMEDMESVVIDNRIKVTCIHQDHSVPGACSFFIESEGKRVLYTGDIRFHGSFPLTIDEYVKKVGKPVDLMLCEGTRVDSDIVLREDEVENHISEQIKNTKGLVFIDFSWKDTSRYETIKKAADKAGRIFVINARLAYLLNKLGMYPSEDDVVVFLKRKYHCLYSPNDYSNAKHEFGLSVDWKEDGPDDTHYKHALVAEDIKKHPDRYVMMLSYFDLAQLFDLADEAGKIPGSFFIKAVCAPFSDDMELDEERLIHWLDMFNIGYTLGEKKIPKDCSNRDCKKIKNHLERAHVSGHASRPELKELIEKIQPNILVPIHTEHANGFKEIVKEVNGSTRVVIPKRGKPIII